MQDSPVCLQIHKQEIVSTRARVKEILKYLKLTILQRWMIFSDLDEEKKKKKKTLGRENL